MTGKQNRKIRQPLSSLCGLWIFSLEAEYMGVGLEHLFSNGSVLILGEVDLYSLCKTTSVHRSPTQFASYDIKSRSLVTLKSLLCRPRDFHLFPYNASYMKVLQPCFHWKFQQYQHYIYRNQLAADIIDGFYWTLYLLSLHALKVEIHAKK